MGNFLRIQWLRHSNQQKWHISKLDTYFILCVFLGVRIDKRVDKNIQNKIVGEIFFTNLAVYMAEGYMAKTMKINKTPTILINFSNCCQFYFSVRLKNVKIGPGA